MTPQKEQVRTFNTQAELDKFLEFASSLGFTFEKDKLLESHGCLYDFPPRGSETNFQYYCRLALALDQLLERQNSTGSPSNP